ncbi:MAG: (2Fe-2S)-binding protein [Planctomycetaceae bacterium]|jgi:NAD(P)H-nitrite reductase large subunit
MSTIEAGDPNPDALARNAKMNPEDKLCYCFHVTHRKVVNWIRINRPTVPSQVSECGGAGTGCGWCVPLLRKLFEAEIHGAASAVAPDAETWKIKRDEYLKSGRRHVDDSREQSPE